MKIWYTILNSGTTEEYNAWKAIPGKTEEFPGSDCVMTAPDSPELRAWLAMAPDNGVVILGVEE